MLPVASIHLAITSKNKKNELQNSQGSMTAYFTTKGNNDLIIWFRN